MANNILIKIDLSSIKPNPNKKQRPIMCYGRKEIKFKCENLPIMLINGENCCISSYSQIKNKKYNFEGYLDNDEIVEKLRVSKEKISISITQEKEIINYPYFSSYIWEYIHKKVKCKQCNKKVKYKNITTEWTYDDEYTYYKCPKCGQDMEIEINYESINEALKRLNKPH